MQITNNHAECVLHGIKEKQEKEKWKECDFQEKGLPLKESNNGFVTIAIGFSGKIR